MEEQFDVVHLLVILSDEAYDQDFIERADELNEAVENLKRLFDFPCFNSAKDEKIFWEHFYLKKQYLIEEQENNPLKVAHKDLLYNLSKL